MNLLMTKVGVLLLLFKVIICLAQLSSIGQRQLTSISGTVTSSNDELTWPLSETNLLLILKKPNTKEQKTHQLKLTSDQDSFPLTFSFNNMVEIQQDGDYMVTLLIFGYPDRSLWEHMIHQIQIKADQVNNINFTVTNVADIKRCLEKDYSCLETVDQPTHNVSICCSGYHCLNVSGAGYYCVDPEIVAAFTTKLTATTASVSSTTSQTTLTPTHTSTAAHTSTSTHTSTTTHSSTTTHHSTSTHTSTATKTNQPTITFAPVGIYALNIPTCATWNETGQTVAGNTNGSVGSDLGSLWYPVGIFVDNNYTLYVADRGNQRIMKYQAGATSGTIVAGDGTAGSASNQLNGTNGVAIDQSGSIIVADSNNYRVQQFLAGHTNATTLISNSFFSPLGLMRDLHIDVNNNIYVTDRDNHQVVRFEPGSRSGTILAGGNGRNSGDNELSGPMGNYMDENGTLYVADASNQRILKYVSGSPNGTLVAGVNRESGSDGHLLSNPVSIIVDNNGYVYVADQGNNRIVKWTTNYTLGGTCIIACTRADGTAANQLHGPQDLKFDRDGNIYVTDHGNHRIMKYMIQLPTSQCSEG